MTVTTTRNKIEHVAVQDQTQFVFDFIILKKEDMRVSVNNVEYQFPFEVYGVGLNEGGYIELSQGLDDGNNVVLFRYMDATQEVDYKSYDKFPAETHEVALDKLTLLVQQLNDFALGAIRFPLVEAAGPNSILPPIEDRALKYVFFDLNGGVTVSDGTEVGGPGVRTISIRDDGHSVDMIGVDNALVDYPELFVITPNSPFSTVQLDALGHLPESVFPEDIVRELAVMPHSVDMLNVDNESISGVSQIGVDQPVNSPLSLIQLDSQGHLPLDLVNWEGLRAMGIYRGDDLCPKFNDGPGECIAPDYRNPTERWPDETWQGGQYFIITLGEGEITGNINLIPELGQSGNQVISVDQRDGIVYIEEGRDDEDEIIIYAGWYKVEDIVGATSAENVVYDSTFRHIILPQDTNAQLAIDRLDEHALDKINGGEILGVTKYDRVPVDEEEIANKQYVDFQYNTVDNRVENLENEVNLLEIRIEDNENDLINKIEADDYAQSTKGGTVKVRRSGSNAYFSTTSTNP